MRSLVRSCNVFINVREVQGGQCKYSMDLVRVACQVCNWKWCRVGPLWRKGIPLFLRTWASPGLVRAFIIRERVPLWWCPAHAHDGIQTNRPALSSSCTQIQTTKRSLERLEWDIWPKRFHEFQLNCCYRALPDKCLSSSTNRCQIHNELVTLLPLRGY